MTITATDIRASQLPHFPSDAPWPRYTGRTLLDIYRQARRDLDIAGPRTLLLRTADGAEICATIEDDARNYIRAADGRYVMRPRRT